jgi:hypothetical protein
VLISDVILAMAYSICFAKLEQFIVEVYLSDFAQLGHYCFFDITQFLMQGSHIILQQFGHICASLTWSWHIGQLRMPIKYSKC